MAEPQDSSFWREAVRSGAVAVDQLRACWDAIPPDKRAADEIDRRLARQVVNAGHLTAWQAQQIGRGAQLNIDKYTLVDMIGEGGMGRVFLARDTRLNRLVALKVLSQGRLRDERAIARFRREARLGARLQHENLVRIYDEGETNGRCYLVMEHIEGASVGHLLAEHGPMPALTAARLARQVAQGLAHAHWKGMIHRDVNPHNIMVTRQGVAKLTDMGLAIEVGDGSGLTLDGSVIGNYDYISPEQVYRSRDADSRSDVYSLGCTLYHMVAGRVPFPSSSLPEKIHAHLKAEPSPLGSIAANLPEGFEEVVSRMMRKSPDERLQGPMEVADALGRFFSDGASMVGAEAMASPHPRRDRDQPTTSASSSSSGEIPPTGATNMTRTTTSHVLDPGSVGPPILSADPTRISAPDLPSRGGVDRLRWARDPESRPLIRWGLIASLFLLVATPLASVMLSRDPPAASAPGTDRGQESRSLIVSVVKADGTEEIARDLRDALRRAGRDNPRIVLRGSGVVRLAGEGLEINSGTVTLTADPVARPSLVVDLSGGEPFLRVGARGSLRLDGLSIRVEYARAGRKAPPLIEAKGSLDMRRCRFWTADDEVVSGGVSAEGPRLSATGCWFGGFKQTLDVGAFAGTSVVLEQCMMIQSPTGDPWSRWAIRLHHESSPAVAGARRLIVRRCTIRDACLLRADDFKPETPLDVTIEGTVIQAGILLAWRSESRPERGCLDWSGRDNLYDLSRASRAIRLDDPSKLAGGPIDAKAWATLLAERRCQERPIPFPDYAPAPQGPPRPTDYPAQDREGQPVGADPGQVGPEV